MRGKIKCPVCRETLELKEGALAADRVVCTACGSQLELKDRGSQLEAKRWPQPPEEEIRGRIDTFARLKGLEVSDRKERIIAGLIKNSRISVIFTAPAAWKTMLTMYVHARRHVRTC